MSYLRKILETHSGIVYRHFKLILLLVGIVTIILGIGIKDLELESDVTEQMPQHLPIFQLNDRIENNFAGEDTIFLLFKLDEDVKIQERPTDILSPEIMDYIDNMHNLLEKENKIVSVQSLSPVIESTRQRHGELTTENMQAALEQNPMAKEFVSSDRKKTIMILSTDIGGSEEQTRDINQMLDEKIDGLSKPAGTSIMVTGNPPLRNVILDLLRSDAVTTLAIAFIIILVMLVILQSSLRRALMIGIPLLLAIVWTAGTLSWLGIKLSFATAGLGAMILGLGVEYGIFMLSRYREERAKRNLRITTKETITNVGVAIIGSGSTTIVGFLALTFSIIPMMQNLGLSLAIGIVYCIIATVAILPALIIATEKLYGVKI